MIFYLFIYYIIVLNRQAELYILCIRFAQLFICYIIMLNEQGEFYTSESTCGWISDSTLHIELTGRGVGVARLHR